MEDKIINILVKVCDDEAIKIDKNIDLIETNILDSLAFINLIAELESEFKIEIQPTQIEPDTWRSIDKIVKMVEDKIRG